MLKQRFSVCSWIGCDMSQIKLTEYQTMHQNANQDFEFVHGLVTI